MQALRDLPLHVGVEVASVAFRQIVEMQRRDMHRRLGRFEMQEQRIQPGERLQSIPSLRCFPQRVWLPDNVRATAS